MRQLKITKSFTNRESASLDKYLQDIGHEPLLSLDEEVELARRIREGEIKPLKNLRAQTFDLLSQWQNNIKTRVLVFLIL